MTRLPHANGIRIFEYSAFAQTLGDRIWESAASGAAEAGVRIEYISRPSIRKEDVVARLLEQHGDHPCLVFVISAMECYLCHWPPRDSVTGKIFVQPDTGTRLHY
jgi:hypothetical protein